MITGTDFILTLPRRIQQLLANEAIFNHCSTNGLPGFTLDMQWSQSVDQGQRQHVAARAGDQSLRRAGNGLKLSGRWPFGVGLTVDVEDLHAQLDFNPRRPFTQLLHYGQQALGQLF